MKTCSINYLYLSPILLSALVLTSFPSSTIAEVPNSNATQLLSAREENLPANAERSTAPVAASPADSNTTNNNINNAARSFRIRTDDWAYLTIQSLNQRHDCGADIPQRTMTRREMGAAITACAQVLERKVALANSPAAVEGNNNNTSDVPAENDAAATIQDIAALKQLAESFQNELTDVNIRLQVAETAIARLPATPFSMTTKLVGEGIMSLGYFSGGRNVAAVAASGTTAATAGSLGSATNFTDRVRLNFDSTFSGQDRLRTRLQSRNTTPYTPRTSSTNVATNMTRFGYDGNESNNTGVSLFQYSFPLSTQTRATVEVIGSEYNENMYTFNPLLTSSGSGSISRFGRYNPVYRQSGDGAAVSIDHKFNNQFNVSVGYAVPGAASTSITPGIDGNTGSLFGGPNSFIVQAKYSPNSNLDLGLVYANSYHPNGANVSGGTGSGFANNPFSSRTTANHYNFLISGKVSANLVVSGWLGLTEASQVGGSNSASIYNFAVSAALPNFGAQGNTLALIAGVPPRASSNTLATRRDIDTSLHLEALYKIRYNDNIDITPGVLLITSPEHNSNNNSIFVGVVRTTFKF
jgi:hypothetical protein